MTIVIFWVNYPFKIMKSVSKVRTDHLRDM